MHNTQFSYLYTLIQNCLAAPHLVAVRARPRPGRAVRRPAAARRRIRCAHDLPPRRQHPLHPCGHDVPRLCECIICSSAGQIQAPRSGRPCHGVSVCRTRRACHAQWALGHVLFLAVVGDAMRAVGPEVEAHAVAPGLLALGPPDPPPPSPRGSRRPLPLPFEKRRSFFAARARPR